MRITGKTRVMFILADPVDHILGTDVLNRAFADLDLDVATSPLWIAPADLAEVLRMIRRLKNVAGFGVTIPHKIAVVDLVDNLTEAARHIGAVNFVRRNADGTLTGHNIDGAGFLAGLAAQDVAVGGARVLQVGAGGVGRAIAFALAHGGAETVTIANRNPARADTLVAAIRASGAGCVAAVGIDALPPLDGFDLVINATSIGMHEGDPLPFDPTGLRPGTTVAEVIMTPEITAILAAARDRGCRIVPGMAMMQPQPLLVARFLGLAGAP